MNKCSTQARTSGRGAPSGRGFTLIELLVVIVILGILSGIGLVVAGRVSSGGKSRLSEDVLRVLDQVITSYSASHDAKPPAYYTDPTGNVFPLVDGRYTGRTFPVVTGAAGTDNQQKFDRDIDPPQPALTFFLLMASGDGDTSAIIQGIDKRLIEQKTVAAWGWQPNAGAIAQFSDDAGAALPGPKGPVIKDGWGRPIRLAHPAFDGGAGPYFAGAGQGMIMGRPIMKVDGLSAGATPADFSRSYRPFPFRATAPVLAPFAVGDSDEGICQGNRPYVYTGGSDGDPGTRSDNVYTTRPEFPTETAKLEFD